SGRSRLCAMLCLFLLIVMSLGLSGCGAEEAAETTAEAVTSETSGASGGSESGQAEVIEVGIVEPLTGTPIGLPWLYGYELFFDKVNEEGGVEIAGTTYTFEYYSADDKFTAEGAAIAAKQLIEQE